MRFWINYKGMFPDGTVFDDNEDGEPLEVLIGARHSVMEPLENTVRQMNIGEERIVEIPCELAYGKYDRDGVKRIQKYLVPNADRLEAGMSIQWTSTNSIEPIHVRVVHVDDFVVELDFNHPLAGKDLVYWVKVVDILD